MAYRRDWLGVTIALAASLESSLGGAYSDMKDSIQRIFEERIKYQLANHYRMHGRSQSRSNVAQAKRAKQARRNIAKRNRSASQ